MVKIDLTKALCSECSDNVVALEDMDSVVVAEGKKERGVVLLPHCAVLKKLDSVDDVDDGGRELPRKCAVTSLYKVCKKLEWVFYHGDVFSCDGGKTWFCVCVKPPAKVEMIRCVVDKDSLQVVVPLEITANLHNTLAYMGHLDNVMFTIPHNDILVRKLGCPKIPMSIAFETGKGQLVLQQGDCRTSMGFDVDKAVRFCAKTREYVPPFFASDLEECPDEHLGEDYTTQESNLYKEIMQMWWTAKERAKKEEPRTLGIALQLDIQEIVKNALKKTDAIYEAGECKFVLHVHTNDVGRVVRRLQKYDIETCVVGKPVEAPRRSGASNHGGVGGIKEIKCTGGSMGKASAVGVGDDYVINPTTGYPIKANGALAAKLRKRGLLP